MDFNAGSSVGRRWAELLAASGQLHGRHWAGSHGRRQSDSVIVAILGADDPIAAVDDHLLIAVGETLEHAVTDNDVETSRRIDIDTLEIVAWPELGSASVLDTPPEQVWQPERVIQYTPDNLDIDDYDRLEDSLTYRICDRGPDTQCATAQLRISVYPRGYDPQRGF